MAAEPEQARRLVELISMEIAGQEFCIDIRAVREIRGWTQASPMPQAPDYFLGVINLRGLVMPVIDLRRRLGLGASEIGERSVVVVVMQDDKVAGLLVDAVQETFVVEAAQLQEPPEMGDLGGGPRFVDAILPLEGRMLSRLVVGSLLPAETVLAA